MREMKFGITLTSTLPTLCLGRSRRLGLGVMSSITRTARSCSSHTRGTNDEVDENDDESEASCGTLTCLYGIAAMLWAQRMPELIRRWGLFRAAAVEARDTVAGWSAPADIRTR